MATSKKTKKRAKRKAKTTTANNPLKYEQITVGITFTDGEKETNNFYSLPDCLRYIERTVTEDYADTVRLELF